jgi:membrane carboxypeptidase/penicillin-binding protein PbpC
MIEMGRKMGIGTWGNPSNYGLSLTLGGGEVTLLDLAKVYATVVNYGKRPEISGIAEVVNYKGGIFEKNACVVNESTFGEAQNIFTFDVFASRSAIKNEAETSGKCNYEEVLDPRVAYLLTDVLKDNYARSPSFGLNSLLVIPNHPEIAVKTGTSNDLRDNITVGFNQDFLVAVWVGNNDNSPMSRVASGITGASPIWNKIMTSLVSGRESKDWEIPKGLVQMPICSFTASLACEGCSDKVEWFLEENTPKSHCNPDEIQKIRKERVKDKNAANGEVFETAASSVR